MYDYSTLPKVAADINPGNMMAMTKYVGKERKHNWIPGCKYEVLWRGEKGIKDNVYHFEVRHRRVVGKNRNGKEEGYILCITYPGPKEILQDWDFPDLREWMERQEGGKDG